MCFDKSNVIIKRKRFRNKTCESIYAMTINPDQLKSWHSSKEIRSHLGITGCELMHRREKGELEFKKVGNAFFYKLPKQVNKSNDS